MNLQDFAVRTDLALEAREMATRRLGDRIPGIESQTEEEDGITVTRIHVANEQGSKAIASARSTTRTPPAGPSSPVRSTR